MDILPFISRIAFTKSLGSLKLTKPKPRVLFVRLSRTTLAFWKLGQRLKARASTSSETSLPRSPQNMRKSSVITTRNSCKPQASERKPYPGPSLRASCPPTFRLLPFAGSGVASDALPLLCLSGTLQLKKTSHVRLDQRICMISKLP